MAWVVPGEIAAVTADLGDSDVKLVVLCHASVTIEGRLYLDWVTERGLISDQSQINRRVDSDSVHSADGASEHGPCRLESCITRVVVEGEGCLTTE